MTFEIGLREGSNLVSLPILPDTSAFQLVTESIASRLILAQDDMGKHFVPMQGVEDLQRWSWDEAYRVVVNGPSMLVVAGAEIVPDASPITLEAEVGNWVPFLRKHATHVEEALASVASSLLRVEDGNGSFYEPGNEASTLDSLHAGQGYRVWVAFRSNRLAMVGLGVVVALILVALFADLIAPYDPLQQDLDRVLEGPSGDHWFGTDELGRDVLSRVLFAARVSLHRKARSFTKISRGWRPTMAPGTTPWAEPGTLKVMRRKA